MCWGCPSLPHFFLYFEFLRNARCGPEIGAKRIDTGLEPSLLSSAGVSGET